ncbi:MAG: NB-ARC domain-containing protein, partial [Stackebrandtia sp.]
TMRLPRPAQLPRDTGFFTGRDHLVSRLTTTLTTGTPIAAISGLGGVGKTALAVRVAHRLRNRFGDGQLFADLRGTESEPVRGNVVLGWFLRALGVPDARIPTEIERRCELFTSVTANRRVFILLDNARDMAQVRPLVTAARHCAVLVTSRSRLGDIPAAARFTVDVLSPTRAHELFGRIVGSSRAESEKAAVRDVVAACGFLPLAVRIAASRALSRPHWTISDLAIRLGDENRRLAELSNIDQSMSAAFELSYAHLNRRLAEHFRWLAAVNLPEFTRAEAATILRCPDTDTATNLKSLVDLGLLNEPAPDHYRFHDLVRLFGSERATADEVHIAVSRLIRHYLATTIAAIDTAYPGESQRLRLARRASSPHSRFHDRESAVEWLNSKAPRISRVVRQVARCQPHDVTAAAELVYAISYWAWSGPNRQPFVEAVGELAEAARRHDNTVAEAKARFALFDCLALWRPHQAAPEGRRVLRLARKCGDDDMYAEACMLFAAAMANSHHERRDQALEYQSRAIEYFDGTPALRGRAAAARAERALIMLTMGRGDEALAESGQAVAALRELGNDDALARGLYQRGLALRDTKHFASAHAVLCESRKLAHDIRDRPLEMLSLYNLAKVNANSGANNVAMIYAQQVVTMSVEIADDDKRARSLVILGQCLRRAGSTRRGRSCLTEAVGIFERLERPDAEMARRLISEQLDDPDREAGTELVLS